MTIHTEHPGSTHHRGDRRRRRPGARRGRQGDRRQAGGAAAGALRDPGQGPRPARGLPRASARPWPRARSPGRSGWTSREPSSPPTCCPPTSPARSSTTSAPRSSSSGAARCSPGCCWPTRSTARRPRPSPRCSRRCRSGRSPSRARPSRCPSRSTCSRPPTRSSTKAPTRSPRPSSTGSCCGSASATRPPTRSTTSSPAASSAPPGGGRARARSPTPAGLLGLQAAVETVRVDESVGRYCVALAAATREHRDVLTGASPRGSLGLVLTARAFAVLRGRDYVIPEDVKAVARAVLSHRVTVRPELWMTADQRPLHRRRRAGRGPDPDDPRAPRSR